MPYILQRDMAASLRLDTQHFMSKMQTGYLLHPSIPVVEGMKIAELGAGTGIWLIDLAGNLPKSCQLDGFDISDGNYPAKKHWPQNVNLGILNAFGDVPEEPHGRYDVVHIRLWAAMMNNGDPKPLIRTAIKLLKPGGYLQWEEADMHNTVAVGDTATKLLSIQSKTYPHIGVITDWVEELPELLVEAGLEIRHIGPRVLKPEVIPLCTSTYLGGLMEITYQMADRLGSGGEVPTALEWREALLNMMEDSKRGGEYYWNQISLLAQKPSDKDT